MDMTKSTNWALSESNGVSDILAAQDRSIKFQDVANQIGLADFSIISNWAYFQLIVAVLQTIRRSPDVREAPRE